MAANNQDKRIEGPFLELNFYYGETPEHMVFKQLCEFLMSTGAEFTGSGILHRGEDIRNDRFSHIAIGKNAEGFDVGSEEFAALLNDSRVQVVKAYLQSAVGTVPDAIEQLEYVAISEEAAKSDRHPLAIITDGSVYWPDWTRDEQEEKEVQAAGVKAYKRFLEIVQTTSPVYATMSCELPLSCPTDLRRDPHGGAFSEFYVSASYLGKANLNRVRGLYSGAYVEEVHDGLYISRFRYLNPDFKDWDIDTDEPSRRSVEVARIIAENAR